MNAIAAAVVIALGVAIGVSLDAQQPSVVQAPRAATSLTPPPPAASDERVPDKAQFEEAAIRECPKDPEAPEGARGGGANSLLMTPGRFYVQCMTVATLVRTALGYAPAAMLTSSAAAAMRIGPTYGLGVEDGRRVRGGADWVRSDKYSIEAVADPAAGPRTMSGPMLKDLLERRLQLKTHVESEDIPGWFLVLAKSGLKIRPMAAGDCTREEPSETVTAQRARFGWSGPVIIGEAARFGIKPTCGAIYGEPSGPNMRFEIVAHPPGAVAGMVQSAVGARVVDHTGITGKYIFTWEYGPDETTPGTRPMMSAPKIWTPKPGFDAPPTTPKAAPLFVAIEQQLGLTVEPTRVPREYIVIDRIARPTAN